METSGINSKKIVLLITGIAVIGLAIGFIIWYVTSKSEKPTTVSSNQNKRVNPNTGGNTDQNKEEYIEDDTEENSIEDDTEENSIEDDTEEKICFTPKDKSKHFELFVRLFKSKLGDRLELLFKDQPYKDIRGDLEPLLYAINYDRLVKNISGFLLDNENMTSIILSKSKFKTYNIQDAEEKEAETMLGTILDDNEIIEQLVITDNNIRNLKIISLSGFKFKTLPSVFKVFKSLKDIFISETGVESIEPLEEATGLYIIYADGNKIKKIPYFNNITNLGHLDLSNNPIKRIPDDFTTRHIYLHSNGGG